MTEVWKPIPDFPGYEVSDRGRVRSYHKPSGQGSWRIADKPQRILSPATKSQGYKFLQLRRDGETYPFTVHQLVAIAFLGPCPNGLQVCHADDNPGNNHLQNLRYDTQQANFQDARRNGIQIGAPGKLDSAEVQDIRHRYARGESAAFLADAYDVSEPTIYNAVQGKSYKHVPGPITQPWRSSLSGRKVGLVKRIYATGKYTMKEIGIMFGRSESGICRIINGNRRNGAAPDGA